MTKHELVSEVLRKERLLVTTLRIVSLGIATFNIIQFLFLIKVNEGFVSIGTFNVISVVIILTIEVMIIIKKGFNERKIERLLCEDR